MPAQERKRHPIMPTRSHAGLTLFPKITPATFIRRPNRFLVECRVNDTVISAHLPNPGRLWELLLPGARLYVSEPHATTERKTRYTVVAVERDGECILLHTHASNMVVQWLLEHNKIPDMEDAVIVKPEATVGHSRFDFLLEKDGSPFFLEVKSCTLFGTTIAMFPDAVTARGRRHLLELAALAKSGTKCGVLFLVQWPRARYFLPDYHTDIAFARTFYELREALMFKAVAVKWYKDLSLGPDIHEAAIPWELIGREARDSGSYILILHVPEEMRITIGKLGPITFPQGYYLYVGSAKTNLKKRMERHLRKRKRKTFFWHIDYLRDRAGRCTALPIRSEAPLEHELAQTLGDISDWQIPGFGCSDCSCATHLFGMHHNPVENSQFIDILLHFRINRLEAYL
jgi:sugar fermentation stimulation protein A